jgi:O-antigen ligase
LLAFGIPILAIGVFRPVWVLYCVILVIPFRLLTVANGITVVKLAGLLLFLVWIINKIITRDFKLEIWPQVGVFFVIIAFFLVGYARTFDAEIAMKRIQQYLLNMAFFYMVIDMVRTRARIEGVRFFILLGCGAMAVNGLVENLFFTKFYVDQWGNSTNRLISTVGDANVAALFYLGCFPLALFSALDSGRRKADRIFSWIISALLMLGIILSYSRSAAVTMALVGMFMIFRFGSWKRTVSILLIMIIAGIFFMPQTYKDRVETLFTKTGRAGSINYRYRAIVIGSRMINDHPFMGIGLGNYIRSKVKTKYSQESFGRVEVAGYAHNSYLEWAIELGFLGLFPLIVFILLCLWHYFMSIRNVRERDPGMLLLFRGFQYGCYAMLIDNLFLSQFHEKYIWITLAMSIVCYRYGLTLVKDNPELPSESHVTAE